MRLYNAVNNNNTHNTFKSLSEINVKMCLLLTTCFVIKYNTCTYFLCVTQTRGAPALKCTIIILLSHVHDEGYKCVEYWRVEVIFYLTCYTGHDSRTNAWIPNFFDKLNSDDRGNHRSGEQDFQHKYNIISFYNVCII